MEQTATPGVRGACAPFRLRVSCDHRDDTEPDKVYQITNRIAMVWPYFRGRLQGGHVYENSRSREVLEVDTEYLTDPDEARVRSAPLPAQTPHSEIEEDLRLFVDD